MGSMGLNMLRDNMDQTQKHTDTEVAGICTFVKDEEEEEESESDENNKSNIIVQNEIQNENEYGNQMRKRYPYPVRPDAQDCTFYMKTGTCKFGSNCKFNHPVRRKNQVIKIKF